MISFTQFRVKTGNTKVLIIKGAIKIVLRAADTPTLTKIGAPKMFSESDLEVKSDDSDDSAAA